MIFHLKQHSKKLWVSRLIITILVVLSFIMINHFLPDHFFSIKYLQSNLNIMRNAVNHNTLLATLLFSLLYILITTLSIPIGSLLSILSGALFGFTGGVVISLLAATIGATFSFLLSRLLFSDFFSRKFSRQIASIKNEFNKNGNNYLLTLRLVPFFPYFLVNIIMGVTSIRLPNYIKMTFIGIVPTTIVHVYAGLSFSNITSIESIASPPVVLSLTLLGFFPYIMSSLHKTFKNFRNHFPQKG